MSNFNPYQPPAEPSVAPVIPRQYSGPVGLGGWLVLVGFGLVLSPFMLFADVVTTVKTVFLNGTWTALTTPGSSDYHVLWGPLLAIETAFGVASFAVWTYMAYLFFAKKKLLPKLFAWSHIFTLGFLFVDAFALQLVRPDLPFMDPATSKEVVRSIFSVCVWVPYMLVSKRVAATFIH